MKEEIAKSLIQKSTIKTSEDFTDTLLLKIEEAQSKPVISVVRVQRYPLLAIIVGGIAYFMVLFSGFLPKLEVFDYQFQLHKTPFLVILLIILLMGINHLLRLQSYMNAFNRG